MSNVVLDEALRAALDVAPVGVALISEDLRLLYANPRIAVMFGFDAPTMLGGNLGDWATDEGHRASLDRLRARFSGSPVELGTRSLREGIEAYLYSLLTTVDGKRALFIIAVDAGNATDRGVDQLLLDHLAGAASVQIGASFFNGLVLAMTRTLGVDYAMVAELAPEPGRAQAVAVAARDSIMPPFAYDLEGSPCANVLHGGLCWCEKDARTLFPRDRLLAEMEVEGYAGLPLADSHGQPIGLLAIFHKSALPRDTHIELGLQVVAGRVSAELERHRRELELDRSHRYLDELIETASVLIVEIDHDGRLLRANRCFEEVTGYSRAELADDGWMERLQPSQRLPGALDEVRRYLRDGWPREVEAALLDKSGREHQIAWRNSPVRDDRGKVVGILAVGADVTERRRAEAERGRLEESLRRTETLSAIGSLVAGVAHEARNPLFGIAATLDALEAETGTPGATREYLEVLRRDVRRLQRLMDDLLAYGRQHPLSQQRQPIPPLVAYALSLAADRGVARGVRLRADALEPLPEISVDADRLLQVLENLLSNAIALSPEGGEVVLASRFDADAGELVISVRDEGPGFHAEDLPRVFEPFYSRRRGGTGMGLAIVHRIVAEHGGTVSARNGEGGGAVVEVRLPAGASC